jgi:putative sterol carrier protein
MLGGLECNGISGYVDDLANFEVNEEYSFLIEKAAENLYRSISQKLKNMPTSNMAVRKNVLRTKGIELSPQETEQLSKYASDDRYVKQQKEDIEQLANIFKTKLDTKDNSKRIEYIHDFKEHFVRSNVNTVSFLFNITNKQKNLILDIDKEELNCYYGNKEDAEVVIKLTSEVLGNIINGRMTFQRAFMSGEMTAKGDFKTLRLLDDIFAF